MAKAQQFEVYVNAKPVDPEYTSLELAIKRARRESLTHRHVVIANALTGETIQTWANGERVNP